MAYRKPVPLREKLEDTVQAGDSLFMVTTTTKFMFIYRRPHRPSLVLHAMPLGQMMPLCSTSSRATSVA